MSLSVGFFGTAPFVNEYLEVLYNSPHRLAFIVTGLDKPKGRGRVVAPPLPKEFAVSKGIPCFQPEDLNSDEFLSLLEGFDVDIFLVIAYGKKMPSKLLYLPKKHSFNLHFSLLPRWRGAAPVNWAILSGDKETGVTLMKMDEGLDRGDIVFQKRFPIDENETAEELFKKIIEGSKDFLISALNKIELNDFQLIKQDESKATYAPTLKKEDGLINWSDSAVNIHNRIRGLQPWPSAFTFFRGKMVKIFRSVLASGEGEAGQIVTIEKDGLIVATGKGCIKILELQEEGKNRMSSVEFARGKRDLINDFFYSDRKV